ncbi:hypothetical protein L198_03229 [Cryptococcus wingfieldii CBS 7118]|uniref:Uncharacterized protein n=1 Tax=Cryptococcus wingfieldii CBS 7118 TaxID=1295528 RepID=A0A1E3JEW8_9TREE|nr:hypothetical protein L198_03229 [Cryptococcus wingfieldii CBS 7118]ODN99387.1 hypothetical protein L198_03229 [Cryptococcus wingfieldii CBS 7118]
MLATETELEIIQWNKTLGKLSMSQLEERISVEFRTWQKVMSCGLPVGLEHNHPLRFDRARHAVPLTHNDWRHIEACWNVVVSEWLVRCLWSPVKGR